MKHRRRTSNLALIGDYRYLTKTRTNSSCMPFYCADKLRRVSEKATYQLSFSSPNKLDMKVKEVNEIVSCVDIDIDSWTELLFYYDKSTKKLFSIIALDGCISKCVNMVDWQYKTFEIFFCYGLIEATVCAKDELFCGPKWGIVPNILLAFLAICLFLFALFLLVQQIFFFFLIMHMPKFFFSHRILFKSGITES